MPSEIQPKERNAKFLKMVQERLASLKQMEIPNTFEELNAVRSSMEAHYSGTLGARTSFEKMKEKQERLTAKLEELFKELAVLEGNIERRNAMIWRYVTLGISVLSLVISLIRMF